MRCYRIPHSTNVERVALGLGHKGLAVEWIDIDPADRSPLAALSGQTLVPVLVTDDDHVIADSATILRHLDEHHPEAPLWPRAPAARAQAEVFVEWFNRVWKVPPNAIDAELARGPGADLGAVAAWGLELRCWTRWFDDLLDGRDFLLGEFGIADVIAFPFLKYGVLGAPDGDDERFHAILVEHCAAGDENRNLTAWVHRVDARPRA